MQDLQDLAGCSFMHVIDEINTIIFSVINIHYIMFVNLDKLVICTYRCNKI